MVPCFCWYFRLFQVKISQIELNLKLNYYLIGLPINFHWTSRCRSPQLAPFGRDIQWLLFQRIGFYSRSILHWQSPAWFKWDEFYIIKVQMSTNNYKQLLDFNLNNNMYFSEMVHFLSSFLSPKISILSPSSRRISPFLSVALKVPQLVTG